LDIFGQAEAEVEEELLAETKRNHSCVWLSTQLAEGVWPARLCMREAKSFLLESKTPMQDSHILREQNVQAHRSSVSDFWQVWQARG
jgi:hypothetical protein